MKNAMLLFVSFLVFTSMGMGQDQQKSAPLPDCHLGTAFAVDPFRPLAQGEEIVDATGGPVVISQRETPNSIRIVYRHCNLPKTKAVVGGSTGPWVKICGNQIAQTEGWSLPLPSWMKNLLQPPAQKPPEVVVEKKGDTNIYVYVKEDIHIEVENKTPPVPVAILPSDKKKKSHWGIVGVVAAVVAVVVVVAVTRGHSSKDQVVIVRPPL